MATSPLNVQPSFHARSNSLPSRQHPITSQIDENLNRLRASQSASTSSSIENQLNCLQDLYDPVDMTARDALSQTKECTQDLQSVLCRRRGKDGETGAVISTLKQVEAVTINVLESLLSFISGPEAESKSSSWSLFSKLMQQKKITCEEEEQKTNEIADVEATLRSLIKSGSMKNVENVKNELEKSEMCIQDLDEGLESFFRRLIKARVTVLNILNC
ncbi:putative Eukaryotic translation initiation factor 3 subunit A [Hibiscus syriacus]|uniref:Eukaryotic translation initiation factor 3 subunit A n=1 Tax=Hibiscus syriacus TaxID=106335 RepID=A0A6A3AQ66_HIBSY|nr:uncharacterized protein LOC120123081 [Hibiscus syriacus]KAE8706790.1 putative Eukaryotic translation initiation factor 3 subunit A [Hibiscus syriacus]